MSPEVSDLLKRALALSVDFAKLPSPCRICEAARGGWVSLAPKKSVNAEQ